VTARLAHYCGTEQMLEASQFCDVSRISGAQWISSSKILFFLLFFQLFSLCYKAHHELKNLEFAQCPFSVYFTSYAMLCKSRRLIGYHGNEINKPLQSNGHLPYITHVGSSHKVSIWQSYLGSHFRICSQDCATRFVLQVT
jgi:hypothetical protein